MLKDVVTVKPLDGFRLHVRFEDGAEGVVDVAQSVPLTGVFAPLRDPARFASARVVPELGTVCWDSGADLDPDVLYALVTGEPIICREAAAKSK